MAHRGNEVLVKALFVLNGKRWVGWLTKGIGGSRGRELLISSARGRERRREDEKKKLKGFGQVSKRYTSRNSQCRSIVDIISTALTAEPGTDCDTTIQDWSPTEKCPFCNGSRISTDDYSEKDSMRIEPESESAISDGEYYAAGCSNQTKIDQGGANSSENTGHLESSGGSQSCLSYIHPFSNLCTPSVLPVMTPFVPLPEIANQLFCQSLLQWSTSNLLLQQISSQRSPGKENGDHLIQHMIPSVSTKSDNVKRAAHICINNDLPALYAGLSKSSFNNGSLEERPTSIYKEEYNTNGMIEEDQPLDLSSRRALQAATQCAASSVYHSRDGRRLRALINISDKSSNSLPKVIHSSMNKRNYTQADLDAAVRDIRCGRLGTRRASVVYGIPRLKLFIIYNKCKWHWWKKKRMNSFGTVITADRVQSPLTATVPYPNNANAHSTTKIIIPPTQALITIDGMSMSEIQEIGSNNKPCFRNQEPINANDEPIVEKNSLWSSFSHRETSESKMPMRKKKRSDALDEAVRSVRRGEMSVHRAGSFYGVPHSTLEYKVKERNLTRTKCKKATAEHIFDTTAGRANSNNIEGPTTKDSLQHPPLVVNPTKNDVNTAASVGTVSILPPATSAVPS
ncbi:Mushroom body large-type Kenyon cell-specific protein 1 [Dirofilaria immitis]|nr:Mushroom body large-type Kenyon cell-specific protein 1 [Dirofilaria immitis]